MTPHRSARANHGFQFGRPYSSALKILLSTRVQPASISSWIRGRSVRRIEVEQDLRAVCSGGPSRFRARGRTRGAEVLLRVEALLRRGRLTSLHARRGFLLALTATCPASAPSPPPSASPPRSPRASPGLHEDGAPPSSSSTAALVELYRSVAASGDDASVDGVTARARKDSCRSCASRCPTAATRSSRRRSRSPATGRTRPRSCTSCARTSRR